MFRKMRDKHRQVMAEMAALEAQEEGITAAEVISPPKEKISPSKVLFLLGGIGAAVWFLGFSEMSPFASEDPEKKAPEKDEPGSAHHILNQIKYGQMDNEK